MKILCVYFTRSGLTEEIIKKISQKLGAEQLEIWTGNKHPGFFGYIAAAFEGLSKKLPRLMPYKTELPFSEYDKIILAAPVWCEKACPGIRAFLVETKDSLKGDVYFVLTHMSNLSYEERITDLEAILGKKFSGYVSIQTKNHDWTSEIEAFSSEILCK